MKLTPEAIVVTFLTGSLGLFLLCILAKPMYEMLRFVYWMLAGGEKCKGCKQRVKEEEWLQWHQKEEKDYDGYVWCPYCDHRKYEGFEDRAF